MAGRIGRSGEEGYSTLILYGESEKGSQVRYLYDDETRVRVIMEVMYEWFVR